MSPSVDLNLKKLFANVTASPIEIQDYLEQFCKRNNLSLDLIKDMWAGNGPSNGHAGGHNFGGFQSGGGAVNFPVNQVPAVSHQPVMPVLPSPAPFMPPVQ